MKRRISCDTEHRVPRIWTNQFATWDWADLIVQSESCKYFNSTQAVGHQLQPGIYPSSWAGRRSGGYALSSLIWVLGETNIGFSSMKHRILHCCSAIKALLWGSRDHARWYKPKRSLLPCPSIWQDPSSHYWSKGATWARIGCAMSNWTRTRITFLIT